MPLKKQRGKRSVRVNAKVAYASDSFKGDLYLAPNQVYMFIFDYPLSQEAHFLVNTGKRGMGTGEIIRKAGVLYNQIYRYPVKYGIWGHDIEDLYFEGISVDHDRRFVSFAVGS